MQLKDVMTTHVDAIAADATVQEAASQMAGKDIGFLVVAEGNRSRGVVTDRDIVVRCLGQNRDPLSTKVGECMTAEAAVLDEEADVVEVAQTMKERRIRRVLVQNRDGQLVGVVSLGDLANATHDADLCGHVLEEVSAPA